MTPPLWQALEAADTVAAFVVAHFGEGVRVGQLDAPVLHDNVVVDFGFVHEFAPLMELLALIAPLHLSCAPVVVAHRADPDGTAAICLRYPACPGETIEPVSRQPGLAPFSNGVLLAA